MISAHILDLRVRRITIGIGLKIWDMRFGGIDHVVRLIPFTAYAEADDWNEPTDFFKTIYLASLALCCTSFFFLTGAVLSVSPEPALPPKIYQVLNTNQLPVFLTSQVESGDILFVSETTAGPAVDLQSKNSNSSQPTRKVAIVSSRKPADVQTVELSQSQFSVISTSWPSLKAVNLPLVIHVEANSPGSTFGLQPHDYVLPKGVEDDGFDFLADPSLRETAVPFKIIQSGAIKELKLVRGKKRGVPEAIGAMFEITYHRRRQASDPAAKSVLGMFGSGLSACRTIWTKSEGAVYYRKHSSTGIKTSRLWILAGTWSLGFGLSTILAYAGVQWIEWGSRFPKLPSGMYFIAIYLFIGVAGSSLFARGALIGLAREVSLTLRSAL
jgi:hypothetical protein